MYLGLEVIFCLSMAPARALFGFEIEPQFNEPYLSTSLQDFWGHRWNLMVNSILSANVYRPIRRMATAVVGRRWARINPDRNLYINGEAKAKNMEGEAKSLVKVWVTILASLSYCYFIASKIPKGKFRLISLFPIFCLFTILPLYLSSVLSSAITAFFITWLANFKLLLFSFGLGPLSSSPPEPLSLPLFISIACLPIRIKQIEPNPSLDAQKNTKLSFNLPIKTLLFAIIVGLNDLKEYAHPKAILVLYCCLVYLFVDIVFGLCNAIVHVLFGIELESPSNDPYLSTSLQDFWGRRWNLMVTNILRQMIYKLIRLVMEPFLGHQWAALPALLATFIVSGLMHELLYFYVTRAAPTWEVTWFFLLHGACLAVEFGLKKTLKHKEGLHWAVSGPLTLGFVTATASCLFFPPLLRKGVDERAIKELKSLLELVKGVFFREA